MQAKIRHAFWPFESLNSRKSSEKERLPVAATTIPLPPSQPAAQRLLENTRCKRLINCPTADMLKALEIFAKMPVSSYLQIS